MKKPLLLGQQISRPTYLATTAWLRHAPFAMWLVKAARPKRIVELGSHNGYSYFTFCQAVLEAGLDTECFAVDTWNGDEHAGFYSKEVYDAVKEENIKYEKFSRLLRKTFDEALSDIEDNSVDLLHIDGRHRYEDLSCDFETWLPKLTQNAIVLFHDTEVRRSDFGVWRYWAELEKQFDTFNFTFQHGLGVLFTGDDPSHQLTEFRQISQTEFGRDAINSLFFRHGEEIALGQTWNTLKISLDQGPNVLRRFLKIFSDGSVKPESHLGTIDESILTLGKGFLAQQETQQRLESTTNKLSLTRQELAFARSRAHWIWKDYLAYKLLSMIAGRKLPLADSTRQRFLRSAAKRDPRRSLEPVSTPSIQLTTHFKPTIPSSSIEPFDPLQSEQWVEELYASEAAQQMANKPVLISVIMPTKNRAARIPAAIESVLDQVWNNWELIIVDDASNDDTADMVRVLYNDPRIRLMKAKGAGVSAARNTGLSAARGELIAYLDSDNTWTPEYLKFMAVALLREKAMTGYAVLQGFGGERSELEKSFYYNRRFDLDALKMNNFIDMNVFMHHRSLFEQHGGFDETIKRMVDWDLILRYCTVFPPVFANAVGVHYDHRPRPDRITSSEKMAYRYVVLNKHLIDWSALAKSADKRDPELVSIITCVFNNPELTDRCLKSIFRHEAGVPFEVIIIDNGSDRKTAQLLDSWSAREEKITLLRNTENMNFSLGNNLGFAHSSGERVVFLNNDTEVTPEWLRTLLQPLSQKEIKGVQPKLLFPDGTIQCIGLVFSEYSPFAYGLYVGRPGDDPLTLKRRHFRALTGACLALRAQDFVKMQGFDPIYINGQEDVDLCLRLGGGARQFTCATDSVVVHHEGKTAGRGKHIGENRAIFAERWADKILPDDQDCYQQDGIMIENYRADSELHDANGLAVFLPEFQRLQTLATPAVIGAIGSSFRLRIPCPNPERKESWGDYHFGVALTRALARQGIDAEISFLQNWKQPAEKGQVDLVLRGLSNFSEHATKVARSGPRLMWMISHPDQIADDELEEYDFVFVASEAWAQKLQARLKRPEVLPLLQCTEAERFFPEAFDPARRHERLFVGNSRKVLRSLVALAIREDLPLSIYGEMWEGLAPNAWLHSNNIPNVELASYYASAGVVLNDHWDTMRKAGFVSNRVFDVLACGAPLVTDDVLQMPDLLREACTILTEHGTLRDAIDRAQNFHELATRAEISAWIRSDHSFNARAREIASIFK